MLNYKQGDLLQGLTSGEVSLIAHQENCEGLNYFHGVAKAIHDATEGLTERHVLICKENDTFGNILIHNNVVNLYSQRYRGKPKLSGIDTYENRNICLENALIKLKQHMETLYNPILGIPLLASGLAANLTLKGDMTDLEYFQSYVAPIVEKVFYDKTVIVYYL
jgi:hypothetical protein